MLLIGQKIPSWRSLSVGCKDSKACHIREAVGVGRPVLYSLASYGMTLGSLEMLNFCCWRKIQDIKSPKGLVII